MLVCWNVHVHMWGISHNSHPHIFDAVIVTAFVWLISLDKSICIFYLFIWFYSHTNTEDINDTMKNW